MATPTLSPHAAVAGQASDSQGFRMALPWLLGSLVATMLPLFGQVPTWIMIVFAGCACWRYLADRRHWRYPSLPMRLIFFAPLAAGELWMHGMVLDATSMLAFLVALISMKVLELRTSRDFTVVSLLSYFMTLSALFYGQSLALILYLSLALLANTVALIRCHGGGGGRGAFWRSGRLALGMIAQAIPVVILLFIIFPRMQGTFLRRFSSPDTGLTGMSEHLQPGSFSAIVQSDEPAFRAKLNSGASPSQAQLYWRGLVLDRCESSMSWSASDQVPLPRLTHSLPPAPGRVEQLITLVPHGERWLFALDSPVEIRPSSSVRAQLMTTGVIRSDSAIITKAIYTVVSDLSIPQQQHMSLDRMQFYSRVPPDVSARARALAQSWRTPGASDADVIHAGLRYFRDGGFSYSLAPGALPTAGALDYFLFHSRQGFCEHYSAAFSTLMRAAGLPSRIVIGYQGGEFNSWGEGHYIVRQSDAHAWCEVWVEGRGWQREDPTAVVAPDRVSLGANNYAALAADGPLSGESSLERLRRLHAPGTLRWLGHNALLAWDSIDQQWNFLVLGYDQEERWSTLEHLGIGDLTWIGGTMLTLAAAFSLLAVGAMVMRVVDRGSPVATDPVRRVYERFCQRLSKAAGIRRDPAEGPLDFARRARGAIPVHAGDIDRITGLYIASRYAAPPAAGDANGGGSIAELKAEVRRFRPSAPVGG